MTTHPMAGRALCYLRDRKEFAERARQLDFSPILSPWSRLRHDNTNVGRLRRLAVDSVWTHARSRTDRLTLLVLAAVWPLRVWVRATRLAWRHGRYVQTETGIPPLRQWLDAVLASARFNYSPTAFYLYRFFDGTQPVGAYVQEMELALLHLRDHGGQRTPVLLDKMLFFDECSRRGLATPPIVGAFLPGSEERWIGSEPGVLPRRDLFLKDLGGQQGEGTERWIHDRGTGAWMRRGVTRSQEEMLVHFRKRAGHRALVVQPALENHPSIRRFAPEALCTLRVITSFDPARDTRPVLVRAVFKIARSGSEVDNLHAGGLASAVDPSSGMLGLARGVGPSDGGHTHHPDTGAEISGTVLPCFQEAVSLARLAHARLNGLPWSVGWDIAITPGGPLLLEGNTLWGADLAQAAGPEPLDPEFTATLAARVEAGSRPRPAGPQIMEPPYRTGRTTRADRGSDGIVQAPAARGSASPLPLWSRPHYPSGDPYGNVESHASGGEASGSPTAPR